METKLEKLLAKIEEDGEKEIDSLEKDAALEKEKIKKEGEGELERIKKEEEEKLEREKKRVVSDYYRNKEFQLNMELLSLKSRLLEQAKKAAQEEANNLSVEEKKRIFQRVLEEQSLPEDDTAVVYVKPSLKSVFSDIFEEDKMVEKDISSDFVIEGEKFVLEVSLPTAVEEVIEKDSDFFVRLLFKK